MQVDGENHDKFKPVDEINQCYDSWYISLYEAIWRIFSFDMHQKWNIVLKSTNLHNEQCFSFGDNRDIKLIMGYNEQASIRFPIWFRGNCQYE